MKKYGTEAASAPKQQIEFFVTPIRGRRHTQGWLPCSHKVGFHVHPVYNVNRSTLWTQGWLHFLCVHRRLASFSGKRFPSLMNQMMEWGDGRQNIKKNRVDMPSICLCRWYTYKLITKDYQGPSSHESHYNRITQQSIHHTLLFNEAHLGWTQKHTLGEHAPFATVLWFPQHIYSENINNQQTI